MNSIQSKLLHIPEDLRKIGQQTWMAALGDGTPDAGLIIALALNAERERCAAIADRHYKKNNTGSGFDSQPARSTAWNIREAILKPAKKRKAKAESSREATPAVETDKAKRGADTLVTVCPALIDDVGGE